MMKKRLFLLLACLTLTAAFFISGCASAKHLSKRDQAQPEPKARPEIQPFSRKTAAASDDTASLREERPAERKPIFSFRKPAKKRDISDEITEYEEEPKRASGVSFFGKKDGVRVREVQDVNGGYLLVSQDNDLYLEKEDGSQTKKLTNTPMVNEYGHLIEDNRYIIYYEKDDNGLMSGKYYVISSQEDDRSRKEISWEGFKELYLK